MKSDTQIFEPVLTEFERRQVFDRLLGADPMMKLRGRDESEMQVRLEACDGFQLVATYEPTTIPFVPAETLSVWFYLGSDLFFFRCQPQFAGMRVTLPFPVDLFRKQKRTNFRLTIPETYPASFQIDGLDDSDWDREVRVLDLNSDGAGLLGSSEDQWQLGQVLRGFLKMGSHRKVRLVAEVKHVKPVAVGVQIGTEFRHREGGTEDLLHEVLLLYRAEVFPRKA